MKLKTKSAKLLPWPKGLTRTPVRIELHRKLSALPPGLTQDELAARLRVAKSRASTVAHLFGYQFKYVMPPIRIAYANVDWSQSNRAIAKQMGKTPQAVHLARHVLGKAGKSAADHRAEMERKVAALPAGLTRQQFAAGMGITAGNAEHWAERFGYRFAKPVPAWCSKVDWSQTDQQIAEQIGKARQSVNHMRRKLGKLAVKRAR